MNAKATTATCDGVLVVHRFRAPTTPGDWNKLTTRTLVECDEPNCDGDPEAHEMELPCRWSWPLAHGKKATGRAFPHRRCPQCEHIPRAGEPDELEMHG
jgi:hypothetical protein